MARPREHIHSAAFFGLVAERCKYCAVAGGGGVVAGDHYYLLGRHLDHAFKSISGAALAGRIGYYYIGLLSTVIEQLRDLSGISADKLAVGNAVGCGVRFCVLN